LISRNVDQVNLQVYDFIKSGEKMSKENLKVLCVLYDDPEDKFPPNYARTDIPRISSLLDSKKVKLSRVD